MKIRSLALAALPALVLSLLTPVGAEAHGAAVAERCQGVSVGVTYGGQRGPIAGTLCDPGKSRTLQILVSGFSYNRSYWDVPYKPGRYSYVKAAYAAGLPTLAIDPIGTGSSWHPKSTLVNYDSDVTTLGQVVDAVRAGRFGRFRKVVLVGHSYGSITSYGVAGRYHNVDGVISTGAAHIANYANAALLLFPFLRPAVLDPKFASSGLDAGYVTSAPGAHNAFVNAAHTDPALLSLNEGALKDVGTLAQLATLSTNSAQNLTVLNESTSIDVPMFFVNGRRDPFFCGLSTADCTSDASLAGYEKQFVPKAAVSAYVLPESGHNVNLDLDAPKAYARMTSFVAGL